MTVAGQRVREMNKHSVLLSPEENQTVVALVGPRCVSLATTVAQVSENTNMMTVSAITLSSPSGVSQ